MSWELFEGLNRPNFDGLGVPAGERGELVDRVCLRLDLPILGGELLTSQEILC